MKTFFYKKPTFLPTFSSLSIIFLNLVVILSLFLFWKNINLWITKWSSTDEMSIFVAHDMTASEQDMLESKLKKHFHQEEIQSFTQEETFRLIQSELTTAKKIDFSSEFIQSFPRLYVLNKRTSHPLLMENILREVQDLPGVEEANFGLGWLEKVKPFIDLMKSFGLGFCLLLLIGISFVIKSIVTQRIFSKRNDIQVQDFLGATHWQIRRPLIREAAIMNFAALFLAFGFIFLATHFLNFLMQKESVLQRLGIHHMTFFTPLEMMSFLMGLLLFSVLSAWFSLSQLMQKSEAS